MVGRNNSKRKNKTPKLISIACYPLDFIFFNTVMNGEQTYKNIDGYRVKMNSHRYQLFMTKGVTCVSCGITGKYFTLDQRETRCSKTGVIRYDYHYNLKAVNEQGHEVLMTKDHIIPKSKGGANNLTNYQTMCTHCNGKKADKM